MSDTRRPTHAFAGAPPGAVDFDELLRQGAWLRALARDMLRNPADAEDLSQDVLTVALDRRPPLAGVRLRGWLRQVMRRLAARGARREGERRAIEGEAHPPHDPERDSRERVELQRRLLEAIATLDGASRTVLVLRWFDGHSPQEIARQLGIPPATARKRLSRGLARLRERLDRDFAGEGDPEDGRATWSALLLPLARERQPLIATTSVLTGALVSTKTTLALLAASGACAFLLLADPFERASSGVRPSPSTSAVGHALVPPPSAASRAPAEAREDATDPSTAGALAFVGAERVRVVDLQGRSVQGAKAAWVDGVGRARALELDGDGGCARPPDSASARFFAYAPDHAPGHVRSTESRGDVVVELAPARRIIGTVREDGALPVRPLHLHAVVQGHIARHERELETELIELGVLPYTTVATTRSDGSFVLEFGARTSSGWLNVPSTHRLAPPYDDNTRNDRVTIPSDLDELHLDLVRLPSVTGRFVWADDGSPVAGELIVSLRRRELAHDESSWLPIEADGSFAIGIGVDDRALGSTPEERLARIRFNSLRVWAHPTDGHSVPNETEVVFQGRTFPIDVGTIALERIPVRRFVVVNQDGDALPGASVASSLDVTHTDANGEAELACTAAETIQVLASGQALGSFELVDASPQVLALRRGRTLVIETSAVDARLQLEVSWSETPFERRPDGGAENIEPLPALLHGAFQRLRRLGRLSYQQGPGWPGSFLLPVRAEATELPGLQPNGDLQLRCLNPLRQSIVELLVRVPAELGLHRVVLPPVPSEGFGDLRLQLVTADGSPPTDASIFLHHPENRSGTSRPCLPDGSFSAGPFPVREYELDVRAKGHVQRTLRLVPSAPDEPPVRVLLEAARDLYVRVTDRSGRELEVARAGAFDAAGWSVEENESGLGGFDIRRVPRRPLMLSALVGNRRWTREITADDEHVEWILPAHGLLEVELGPVPAIAYDAALRASLRAIESGDELSLRKDFDSTASGSVSLVTDVATGDYMLVVTLEEQDAAGEPTGNRVLLERAITIGASRTLTLHIDGRTLAVSER